jgi:hypothetical protein
LVRAIDGSACLPGEQKERAGISPARSLVRSC